MRAQEGVGLTPITMQERTLSEGDIVAVLAAPRRGELILERGLRLLARPWRLAREHDLNPWVFVAMSAIGYSINACVFLPWFRTDAWQLAFLILLRVAALVVPTYILLKGKGIAAAFNVSIVAVFAVNTAWHVCYYVYF
ncbi:MAG: hypothetical protein PHU43_00075 [Candidatus Bipolaricaulis sp.]|nr:hypothetical protein [Candidatus Bipolaricaulis sp.]